MEEDTHRNPVLPPCVFSSKIQESRTTVFTSSSPWFYLIYLLYFHSVYIQDLRLHNTDIRYTFLARLVKLLMKSNYYKV